MRLKRLNRTFYGIETFLLHILDQRVHVCLNRTFYGIETDHAKQYTKIYLRLNRTFYGIETLII